MLTADQLQPDKQRGRAMLSTLHTSETQLGGLPSLGVALGPHHRPSPSTGAVDIPGLGSPYSLQAGAWCL